MASEYLPALVDRLWAGDVDGARNAAELVAETVAFKRGLRAIRERKS